MKTPLGLFSIPMLQYLVDNAVFKGFLGTHEIVSFGIDRDSLHVLASMVGQYPVQTVSYLNDLLGMNGDVASLVLKPT